MKEKNLYKSKASNFFKSTNLFKYSWVSCPDDLGVKQVHGRVGAALGPQSLLMAFDRLHGDVDVQQNEAGRYFMKPTQQLEKNYQNCIKVLHKVYKNSAQTFPILVGGGHDYAYPWAKAWKLKNPKKALGILNIDAHFDLRPYLENQKLKMTSGSGFRRLIDEKIILGQHFVEFGIQPHCNAQPLWDYAKKMKIQVIELSQTKAHLKQKIKKAAQFLSQHCDEIYLSIDLDALQASYCSGVSAPQADGFTAQEMLLMIQELSCVKKVTSLGIFELAPKLEVGGSEKFSLSARLAAQLVWTFIRSRAKN